jgi:GH24 family phage-related lysozyme (muramidase)
MHASAEAAWYEFIKKHEGEVAFMYLDTKGLVTVGIGNLIDPMSLAVGLPFQFKADNRAQVAAGKAASRAEIEAEWKALKNHPKKEQFITGGHRLCASETDLELSGAGRQQLFRSKSTANEQQLKGFFPDFDLWPADAQLGLMAMGWGLGAGFPAKWPKFSAACKKRDFDAAAADCNISTWRAERNAASRRFFGNAAHVLESPALYSVSELYYPNALTDAVAIAT